MRKTASSVDRAGVTGWPHTPTSTPMPVAPAASSIGPFGNCDHQEGLGSSYALLFDIADATQTESVFANQHVTPAGLPCGWPNLVRYERPDGMSFGRHVGTVWPQIQGFWAEAAARAGKADVFGHEFFNLAAHAARDKHFAEIYHPITGQWAGVERWVRTCNRRRPPGSDNHSG
jgi:hypothetical protein